MIRRALSKTFASLRNRNYRLFFIGQTISNTGNWLTNVAMTLFVLKLGATGVSVGLLAACQYGPILLLSAWGGVVADRYDKRRTLLLTQSLEMCQSISLAVLAFTPHPSLPALYVLAVFGGVLLAFDNPLRRSFVTEMVPREDIPNAVVLYSTIVNLSRIFGPTLAGLRYIASSPVLWIPFVMFAAIGTLAYNFNVTLPLFVTGALHSSGTSFTRLYSVLSFGAVVCALIVAQRGLVRLRHIIVGAVLFGVAMLLFSLVPNVVLAIPAVFLVGMASILYMTATTAIVQVEAKPEMHGRVLSLQTVLMGGSTAVGGPILGWLADNAGARVPLILGGFVCLATAVFGAIADRRLRDAPGLARSAAAVSSSE